jgi:uncharacterized iron-regulated membrane protein
MSGKSRRSRPLVSTQSVHRDLPFDRYLMSVCSLMLMVVLVVGAAGYAGVQGLFSSTTSTAQAARLERANRDANADGAVTADAVALALIAAFLLTVSARAASTRRYPIGIP